MIVSEVLGGAWEGAFNKPLVQLFDLDFLNRATSQWLLSSDLHVRTTWEGFVVVVFQITL